MRNDVFGIGIEMDSIGWLIFDGVCEDRLCSTIRSATGPMGGSISSSDSSIVK